MAADQQLDAARPSKARRVKSLLLPSLAVLLLALNAASLLAQQPLNARDRVSAVEKLYAEKKWEETAQLASGPATQSAELDYVRGMALVHLERWQEARDAFSAGQRKAPKDARFLVERAGAEYRMKDLSSAKEDLRKALRLNPKNEYSEEFLGTIYLLEGNLDAALKYWNPLDKPRLARVSVDPEPHVEKELTRGAITFSAPQVLTRESLLTTSARLENLGVFPQLRVELAPAGETDHAATLHLGERSGWGNSTWGGLVSLLSGAPYQTIYPEWYNIADRAINFSSIARWDAQKRRVFASLSSPVEGRAERVFSVFVDARDENWNLSHTFSGSSRAITDLNLRRLEGGIQLRSVVNGNWSWNAGTGVIGRKFLNEGSGLTSVAAPFFTNSTSLEAWLGVDRTLLRIPERRFKLQGSAESRFGRGFKDNLGPFGTLGGSVRARWFPHARGDDDEIRVQIRSSNMFGDVPLDQLFELGLDRDNGLWLRGHGATTAGKKGRAPLGRRYVLLNSEYNKTLHDGGFFRVQAGPFLDTGKITDPTRVFGDHRWLVDMGVQVKLRVLGSVSVVLSYGRDLRNGQGSFFGTTER
jgi:tetratricopeptide (TPR) repeat protein